MIRVGLIGLGKMGLSHQAILNAHPKAKLSALCDATPLIADVMARYTGCTPYTDYKAMLEREPLDAVLVATPSRSHTEIVRRALDKNLHVFCEKPFTLKAEEGLELSRLAEEKGLVNQVGYHYRFVATFHRLKTLLESGTIGRLHHIRAEAYGPVVLRPKGGTWRSRSAEGGGCLYDYASHAIDLLHYLVGETKGVSGARLGSVFSADVDDEVYALLDFKDGLTGQLSANWSDESFRKMSMKISVWGDNGRIVCDRQELQIFLRSESGALPKGWSTEYTTDLTDSCWYYLRGEEYSAQIDHFVSAISSGDRNTRSTFASACLNDGLSQAIIQQASARPVAKQGAEIATTARKASIWTRWANR